MINLKYLAKFKKTIYLLLFILTYSSIIAILNSIVIINEQINSLLSLIGISLFIFIESYKNGKNTNSKAYKMGLKNGLVAITTLMILSIITGSFSLKLSRFLYYAIILVISITGSIIGINKKM